MKDPKRISRTNNPYYPLPPDYYQLSTEGRRQARVNGCRQFLVKDRFSSSEDLVASVNCFDALYLRQEGSTFYDVVPEGPNPEFHSKILKAIHEHPYTLLAAPRGFAKSTLIRKNMLTVLTCAPMQNIGYIGANQKLVQVNTLSKFASQWVDNTKLIDDFAPEYGSTSLKPPKGQPFSTTGALSMVNGSIIHGISIGGTLRGYRFLDLYLDDPEQDFLKSTNTSTHREWMDRLVNVVLLPMVVRKGTRIVWAGTLVSRRHYIYGAFFPSSDELKSKFEHWNRMLFKAAYPSIDDMQVALWEDYLPIESTDPTRISLKKLIGLMSYDAVKSEYFNEPGDQTSGFLRLDNRHHMYRIGDDDGSPPSAHTFVNPLTSDQKLTYVGQDDSVVVTNLASLIRRSRVFATVDWALSVSPTSDYSTVVVMALTPENELFVLDVWAGRVLPTALSAQVLSICGRWRPSIIGVEAFSAHQHIIAGIKADSLSGSSVIPGYTPRIVHVSPHGMKKSDRISSLSARMGDSKKTIGLLKVLHPDCLRMIPDTNRRLAWKMLHQQFSDFSPLSDDGNLQHDDIIDAVSMSMTMNLQPPAEGGGQGFEKEWNSQEFYERLRRGERVDPVTGIPLIGLVNFATLPPDAIEDLLSKDPPLSTEARLDPRSLF